MSIYIFMHWSFCSPGYSLLQICIYVSLFVGIFPIVCPQYSGMD